MLFQVSCVAAFAAVALSHGDHDQKPIAGPHKSLWYNAMKTIPGDGGTQVCAESEQRVRCQLLTGPGGFRLLGHLNLWASAILPLSGE